MDRHPDRLPLLSLCPVCFDAAGLLADGARAGALVLALVAAGVIAGLARFAWRLRDGEAGQ